MQRPKFSILIPTRDRPELLRFALESAKRQTWEDFEVIVSDNSVAKPARAVFDEYADARFRYVRPPGQVSMADNWEFASLQARGEHVTVLIDKTVLLPSTLRCAADVLARSPADIVSWWEEGFHLDRELQGNFSSGLHAPKFVGRITAAREFDPRAELARRFRFDVRRGSEGVNYGYGKICFGMFSAALIERLRARFGRVFYPLCPDYTSMLLALSATERALDMGRPGLMSVHTATVSNGARFVQNAAHANWFANTSGPDYAPSHWPIADVYASSHNLVAFDYMHCKRRAGDAIPFEIDVPNLLLRTCEDLDEVGHWSSPQQKAEQYAHWQAAVTSLPAGQREHVMRLVAERRARNATAAHRFALAWSRAKQGLKRVPGLAEARRRLLGKHAPSWRFASVIEAAAFVDSHYSPAPRASAMRGCS